MSGARIVSIKLKRRPGEGPMTFVRRKKAAAVIAELTALRLADLAKRPGCDKGGSRADG